MAVKSTVIVDLGLGNLRSVARAVERAGALATISADPDALHQAAAVVVPGQGAFRDCAAALERGFGAALRDVIASGKPYLGLCLGMQILFDGSEESPGSRGLGVFAGRVRRFERDLRDPVTQRPLKIPHMGWNEVEGEHRLLPERGWFYFVHSYHCVPEDRALTVGRAHYGEELCVAIAKDNLFACQFHPEKSQDEGRALLERFVGEL
jgi:glutamine amidotransferase